MHSCKKFGLHNPMYRPERYLKMGQISQKAAQRMSDPDVEYFFARLIQRVCPKSWSQAIGEVKVTRNFLYNFSGDQVRFLARSFGHPGDHVGQNTEGHRWPYGPVAIIAPFNFPLEIPVLQMMGALYMGNRVTLKACSRVSVVMEQFLRLLHDCGLGKSDVDFINTWGPVMGKLLAKASPRMTQFTGSTAVAERLMQDLRGKVKMEGGGFDWKVLGPDAPEDDETCDMVTYQCDQDAYACSGQKCSAQSILFVHENWAKKGIYDGLKALAEKRNIDELTVGPTLSVSPEAIKSHIDKILTIPGAKILFGGVEINHGNHTIPKCYGAMRPTAVFIPLDSMLSSLKNFRLATKEIFAPFQVITEYKDADVRKILSAIENFDEFLTAAIVSNDPKFQQCILAASLNGTTYVGMRARTTGAPQNHWFGPAGDPRSAGIGTPEAIRYTWSCHREIITDRGLLPDGWMNPEQS
jgi:1-pyrroline-5-carboxylate dehydrogenase